MAFVPFTTVANFESISTRSNSGGGLKIPVAGCYPVTVLDAGFDLRDGQSIENAKSVSFHVQITEGEYEGFKTWINAGTDLSKLGNRITWKTILVSLGFDEAGLDGEIGIDTSTYLNLTGYMKFVPKSQNPQNEKEARDQREFVTPTYFADWMNKNTGAVAAPVTTTTFKAAAVATAAPRPAAPAPARAAVPQPAAGAANKYAGLIAK